MDLHSLITSLRDLDSSVLLERFGDLLRHDHRVSAGLLCYIAEIDERQIWAEQGYSSMFAFCVEGFHMSEAKAAKRIQAARTMRRLPLVGEMVARGELHLSGVSVLSKHLTEDNHREVLGRARHQSKRDIEKLVAEIEPRPDAPSRVRKKPRRAAPGGAEAGSSETLFERGGDKSEAPAHTASSQRERRPSRPEPLSPQRYKVEMTIGEPTHDKLTEAQALLSHRVPNGDVAVVFDRALDALLDILRKERAAASTRPRRRKQRRTGTSPRSRHVPAEVRRAVWERDGGRCAYVSPDGRRCNETRWVELHHRTPFARGGHHTVDGIELRCRPHNQYEANRDYGKEFMDRKRRRPQARETLVPYARCA